jgi:hypothetical protein
MRRPASALAGAMERHYAYNRVRMSFYFAITPLQTPMLGIVSRGLTIRWAYQPGRWVKVLAA